MAAGPVDELALVDGRDQPHHVRWRHGPQRRRDGRADEDERIDLTAFGFDQNGYSADYSGYLGVIDDDTYVTFYDNTTGDVVAEVILQDFDYTQIDMTDYIL